MAFVDIFKDKNDFNEKTISLYHQHYYEESEEIELEKYQFV